MKADQVRLLPNTQHNSQHGRQNPPDGWQTREKQLNDAKNDNNVTMQHADGLSQRAPLHGWQGRGEEVPGLPKWCRFKEGMRRRHARPQPVDRQPAGSQAWPCMSRQHVCADTWGKGSRQDRHNWVETLAGMSG